LLLAESSFTLTAKSGVSFPQEKSVEKSILLVMSGAQTGNFVFAIVFIALQAASLCAGSVRIYDGSSNLPIPNDPTKSKGWMDDAIVIIPDHHIVRDIDVAITITHTCVFDLQLYLQSPSGTKICLNMYDPYKEFFKGENYTQTIFDDEADVAIEQAEAPFTGRFKPMQPYRLDVFDGQDTFGQWRLQVYDAFYYDKGTLNNFELIVTTNPEPSTILLFAGGLLLTRLFEFFRRR
jgi:subtilisin-like proprotein convertase family protein